MIEAIKKALAKAGCTQRGNLVWISTNPNALLLADINEACNSSFTTIGDALHAMGFTAMGTSKELAEWLIPEVETVETAVH